MGKRQETGLGAAGAPTVGGDELHRALELGFRDRRILRQDLLVGSVVDALARQFLPIARPIAAEPAIAVIEELRARTGGWPFNRIDGLVSGWLLHDINRALRPAHLVSALVGETVGRYPLSMGRNSRATSSSLRRGI